MTTILGMNVEQELKHVLDVSKAFLKHIADDNELYLLAAKIIRNMYNALIAQGFTEEQALQLVQESNVIKGLASK